MSGNIVEFVSNEIDFEVNQAKKCILKHLYDIPLSNGKKIEFPKKWIFLKSDRDEDWYSIGEEGFTTFLKQRNRFNPCVKTPKILMGRRSGKTTLLSLMAYWEIVSGKRKDKEVDVAVFGHRAEYLKDQFDFIRESSDICFDCRVNSPSKFSNGKQTVDFLPLHRASNSIRGKRYDKVLVDEFQTLDSWDDFYVSIKPCVSSSTPDKDLVAVGTAEKSDVDNPFFVGRSWEFNPSVSMETLMTTWKRDSESFWNEYACMNIP